MPKQRVVRHEVTQPLDQSYRLIPLTQGQNAIVDTKDFEWLNQWNWHARWSEISQKFYAARRTGDNGKVIWMHKVILGCQGREQGDHIKGNSLDNRRKNLRKCTNVQNTRNAKAHKDSTYSNYKGVSFDKKCKKWISQISKNKKNTQLGRFNSEKEAARAYDAAAKILHGEFAHLNFPAFS